MALHIIQHREPKHGRLITGSTSNTNGINNCNKLGADLQARLAPVCVSSPPCRSPTVTWELAPTPAATTNPIGCRQRQRFPACRWLEPPSENTSAAVWCVRHRPHLSPSTVRIPPSLCVHLAGGAFGWATPSSW